MNQNIPQHSWKQPVLSGLFAEIADVIQRISDYPPHIYADLHSDVQAFANQARRITDLCLEKESTQQTADDFNCNYPEYEHDL